jgi:hypothetical protein
LRYLLLKRTLSFWLHIQVFHSHTLCGVASGNGERSSRSYDKERKRSYNERGNYKDLQKHQERNIPYSSGVDSGDNAREDALDTGSPNKRRLDQEHFESKRVKRYEEDDTLETKVRLIMVTYNEEKKADREQVRRDEAF